ncbi:glyceraldehyde-3-phosphate dehydrogenase [Sphingobacterium sp. LRF_L2]|uniref:glyceraldehyde-3-phosphate dehydrogenase n=1 Tax=Sphingobacterium sp. LRF_L2 TaxID=3369421 RepID=UPI003F5E0963
MVQTLTFDEQIKSYNDQQNATIRLIEIVSQLSCNRAVELVLFRNPLVDSRINTILQLHRHCSELLDKELHITETLFVAEIIARMELPPAHIDIGTLALQIREETNDPDLQRFFIQKRLAAVIHQHPFEPKDVILYGFGRIGRLVARELMRKTGSGKQLRLRAIVTRDKVDLNSLEKRANLLKRDSIHGEFEGVIEVDASRNALIINGTTVYFLSSTAPEELNYSAYGIEDALLIDNTGAFRNHNELARHLKANGVSEVLLTAPGEGIPNIVFGVNTELADPMQTSLCSAASCTTNAIAPVLAVIDEQFGIIQGHIETIHSYTNDQNLVDNMHKKSRRGRAAALNMVITETGAGDAIAKVIPGLAGKLTANAIRVPVPNGSLAILQLEIERPCTLAELNHRLREAALTGNLVEQIKYEENRDLVSSDIIGMTACAIIDAPANLVSRDGRHIVIYVWYDNEYGYTQQVIRLARHLAGVHGFLYY